ncbi:MAG: hypothetical protein EHM87_17860 [Burkholderiales bacterium]|nr:MAG: hypothetical protein EHM87_17860 [Burkholderiales bacterium]
MTIRGFRVTGDKAAIGFATQETAYNAGATLDVSLSIAEGDIPSFEYMRDPNTGELTGKEEVDTIYDKGKTASVTLTFDKAKPHQILAAAAFGKGTVVTVPAGTGYLHTITNIAGDVDYRRSNPTTSFGYRLSDINDRIYDGVGVDTYTLTFAKGEFVKLSVGLKMSGKVTESIIEDTITAGDDSTSVSLTTGVFGSTAAERLRNVQYTRYQHSSGYYAPVEYSAVSDSTSAAVLSITPPGSSGGDVDYKVLYTKFDGKITFPAVISESPLKVSRTTVIIGGKWNGTSFEGGRELVCELKNVECGYTNGLVTEFCFGEDADYAGRIWRDARTQTLKVDREFRDMLFQQMTTDSEYFGLYLIAEGAVYDDPHKYQLEIIYPRLAIKTPAVSVDGKRLAESLELIVMEDDTYGSRIDRVKCLVPAVAA